MSLLKLIIEGVTKMRDEKIERCAKVSGVSYLEIEEWHDMYMFWLNYWGYPDWKIKYIESGGGLCCYKSKEIWIDCNNYYKEGLFVHEVAHIEHSRHDVFWADHYTKLVGEYFAP